MPFQRLIGQFLLSVMLLVQAHAALPHQHVTAEGSCGAVCHAHADHDASWWDAVVHGVHDLVHRHAESMACEVGEDRFRPADEVQLEWKAVLNASTGTTSVIALERIVQPLAPMRRLPHGRIPDARSLRGPPNRG